MNIRKEPCWVPFFLFVNIYLFFCKHVLPTKLNVYFCVKIKSQNALI